MRVAGIAIDNRARRTAFHRANAHQFSPERITRRGAGAEIDLVGFEVVKRLQHQAERPRGDGIVRPRDGLVEEVGFQNGQCSSAHDHRAIQRHDRRRQKLTLQADPVQHVADDRGRQLAARRCKQLRVCWIDAHNFNQNGGYFRFSVFFSQAIISAL